MNNEDYVNYELAKKLKVCGFNELTNSFYDEASVQQGVFEIVPTYSKFNEVCRTSGCECVSAPTLAHAQKWLREKKGYIISVEPYFSRYVDEISYIGRLYSAEERGEVYSCSGDCTYEKAIEMCIKEALQLLDNEKE